MTDKKKKQLMMALIRIMMRQTFDLKDLKNLDNNIRAEAEKLSMEPEIAILELTEPEIIEFLYGLVINMFQEIPEIVKEQQKGDL